MQPEQGSVLRIYIGESDKHQGMPMYEWLLKAAKEQGLSGGTVFRGVSGFGAHSRIHSAKILDLSADLPMVVELIDNPEKINEFLKLVDDVVLQGMATIETLQIRRYR